MNSFLLRITLKNIGHTIAEKVRIIIPIIGLEIESFSPEIIFRRIDHLHDNIPTLQFDGGDIVFYPKSPTVIGELWLNYKYPTDFTKIIIGRIGIEILSKDMQMVNEEYEIPFDSIEFVRNTNQIKDVQRISRVLE